MKIGTRSLLFGCHQFLLHPLLVATAWWKLYSWRCVNDTTYGVTTCLLDWKLWICFVVHDLGYSGCPNMDGPEGEQHPHLGAAIVGKLFDGSGPPRWRHFLLYHSRYLAKRDGRPPSAFCMADKLAIALYPVRLWVSLAWLTGEGREYMAAHAGPGVPTRLAPYFRHVRVHVRNWVEEHRSGKRDDVTVCRRHGRETGAV